MNAPSQISRPFLAGLTAFVFLSQATPSDAELRKWTSIKGTTIEAELVSVDAENVYLKRKNGSSLTVKRKDFSAADQKWLVEYGGAKEAPIDLKAKIGVPEKEMKFDSKTIQRREDKFQLGEGFDVEFKMVESEHFIVMSSGSTRGKDTAQLAERMWYGMNFFHPGFKAKWGDKKMGILLCGESEDYTNVGEYYIRNLQEAQQEEAANNTRLTFPKSSGAGISFSPAHCEEYNLQRSGRAFNTSNKTTWQNGVWNPFPTHCLAGDVLGIMMGGSGGGIGSDGYFAIMKGHSYFKEIQLTDETVTRMINANAYAGDEVTQAGGFDDGRKWARTLRDLVKKGKVSPTLQKIYAVKDAGELSPELLVTMYGLSRYMQSTPIRMNNYSTLLDRVDTSRAIPKPIELAKIFGFDSIGAFEADWVEYLKSSEFK